MTDGVRGAALNTIQIEEALEQLSQDVASGICPLHDFPFRLMEAYDASRNEVNKLRMKHPAGPVASDIVWPKKMLYRPAATGDVQNVIESLKTSLIGKKGTAAKNAPRFLVSTDGDEFLAVDIKTGETPGFDRLADLPVNYDYLMPMFGVERYKPAAETTADVRAARHMAKFHDAILDANPGFGVERIHDLNLFMTRILFCMFAEDTGIFEKKLFVDTLRREAMQYDGSDTQRVIEDVFVALDIPRESDRTEAGVRSRRIAVDFPYVNGGLFRDRTAVPLFNRRARRLLLEAADLQWDQIHADIFGSMIQAVIHTDMRADFGMHYTSVPNIMKVLEPLFLRSLREQLTAAGDNVRALERLVTRIANIRVFDPACGSGNFLIIAYRELRQIETEAFRRIRDIKRKGQLALADFETGVRISSFYGIDPVDFACETAKLSLWISQYQMNRKLDEICASPAPALPLTDGGSMVVGNALRREWTDICPPKEGTETYIVGNPPYLGKAEQSPSQKEDMDLCFKTYRISYGKLDYVSCWFIKAASYVRRAPQSDFAFVATNSLSQGEQVGILWPSVLQLDLEILFAHTSFKWANSASKNAGVTCIITGVGKKRSQPKALYDTTTVRQASAISPYLTLGNSVVVTAIPNSMATKPKMLFGNMPRDDGNLILSDTERDQILLSHPEATPLIKPYAGAQDYINCLSRWCLWIEDADVNLAKSIPEIARRLDATRQFRSKSRAASTVEYAREPHRFVQIQGYAETAIIVPRVTSERRIYIPIGYLANGTVINDQAFAIYDPATWVFSLLSSRLHVVWARAVGGALETRIRYSNTLVYNTFPVPDLSVDQRECLEEHALSILRLREPYIADGKTIAWLYNPETMPEDLLQSHRFLDDYFETIYIGRPFRDDAERLEHLFKLYARNSKPKNS